MWAGNHQCRHHDPGPTWAQRGHKFSRMVIAAFSSWSFYIHDILTAELDPGHQPCWSRRCWDHEQQFIIPFPPDASWCASSSGSGEGKDPFQLSDQFRDDHTLGEEILPNVQSKPLHGLWSIPIDPVPGSQEGELSTSLCTSPQESPKSRDIPHRTWLPALPPSLLSCSEHIQGHSHLS